MRTPRELSRRLCTLTLLGLVAYSPLALAHGGPPAALGLLAADGEGPEVILLNEGLAIKRPEAWSYMCPSLWGEVDQASGKFPLARSADGIETWVTGGEDLYLLRDQQLVAQNMPQYRRNEMLGLANDAKYVYGLHLTTSGPRMSSEVVRLQTGGDPTFWQSDVYWSAITANERGVYVARVSAEKQLELATIDVDGKEQSRSLAMLPITPLEMQLHALGDRVYVTVVEGMISLFGYFEGGTWTQVHQATLPIVGPQTSPDGTLWIAVGGALMRVQDNTPQPVEETRFINCLEQWNDWHYACVGSDLHHLTESGIGERIFELNGFHAPDPKLVPAEAQQPCESQWVLYTVDATRSGLMFVNWPKTDDGAAGQGSAGAAAAPEAAANASSAGAAASPIAGSAVMAGPVPSESSGCSVAAVGPRGPRGPRGSFALGWASMIAVFGVWRVHRAGSRRRQLGARA